MKTISAHCPISFAVVREETVEKYVGDYVDENPPTVKCGAPSGRHGS